jgi:hypothetical protein
MEAQKLMEAQMTVSCGHSQLFNSIEDDFKQRLPGYHKSRRAGICTLAALMLDVRSANLMELANALPRDIGMKDKRYQYVERLLANPHIDNDAVMKPYAMEIFARLSKQGQTIILMMDQSKINDLNQVLMLSVRIGNRALPVAWRVRATNGNIGFETQKQLLDAVKNWFSDEMKVMLTADRFYGTAKLIKWCQEAGWSYRIRLKGNLILRHEGWEISTSEAVSLTKEGVENVELSSTGVITNIGTLHEKGHKEPWIIAMDARLGKHKVLDYGLRWGIESMFSDFKSRGFGLAQSQIRKPERLERLILIMTIAMYWAVSSGAYDQQKTAQSGKKEGPQKNEIPVLAVQIRPALPAPLPDRPRKNPQTLGSLDKMRGG